MNRDEAIRRGKEYLKVIGQEFREYHYSGRVDVSSSAGGYIVASDKHDIEKHGHSIEDYTSMATYLDLRGDYEAHPTAEFGKRVTIITASHLFGKEGIERRFLRRVKIDQHAFIGSGATLYNCWIREHALVSIGSVVSNVIVPAWSIVEGNPAVVVGGFIDGGFRRFEDGHTEPLERF